MHQYIPPFYAVHRTALLRDWYARHAARHQLRMAGNRPCVLHAGEGQGANSADPLRRARGQLPGLGAQHRGLHHPDPTDAKSVAEREAFAELLSTLPTAQTGLDPAQGKQLALDSFEAMADSLRTGRALTAEPIFESRWTNVQKGPDRRFGLLQYVEMPFYNQAFFDLLSQFEFLLHAMPAGRVQLQGLEGIWTRPGRHDAAAQQRHARKCRRAAVAGV